MPETLEAPAVDNSDAFAEADAALAQLGAPESAPSSPPAAPAAPPPPEQPKQPEAKPVEPESDDDIPSTPKPKAPEAKPSKPADTKPEPKGKKGESLSEFRKEYETTKAERDALKAQIESTKIEREKLLDEGRKAAAKELQAETEALKKQLADMDVELRFTKYERSKEYRDKYEQPLDAAWKKALNAVRGIKLVDASGVERDVAFDDIYALTKMEEVPAAQRAHELFGAAAAQVMKHRDRIIELEEGRATALKEYREKGSEREAAMAKEREESEAEKFQMFDRFSTEERNQKSEFFAEDPADEEGNKWLRAGIKLARKGVLGEGIKDGLTPQQRVAERVRAQSMVFNRAAAFGRERHRVLTLRAENEALKAKLAQFEKSEPETTDPKDHAPSGKEGDFDYEFQKAGL